MRFETTKTLVAAKMQQEVLSLENNFMCRAVPQKVKMKPSSRHSHSHQPSKNKHHIVRDITFAKTNGIVDVL